MHRTVLSMAYLVLILVVIAVLVYGFSYYSTSSLERPRHDDYWNLKPGGRFGLVFGQIGAGMMTLMLLYSVRRRFKPFRRLGPIRYWLDYHILLGLFGPVFITLHSSFKVGGIVAIAFWAMVVVAASGVFGRYLYIQIPRSRAGDELTLAQVQEEDRVLSDRLRTEFGLPESAIRELEAIAVTGVQGDTSLLALLPRLFFDFFRVRLLLFRFRRRYARAAPGLLRRFNKITIRKAELHRRVQILDRLRRIFHYWHVAHKPFAFIMYIFMAIHIAVAYWTGYSGLD